MSAIASYSNFSRSPSAMRSCACPTCTLNCPRQVSHLTLARGDRHWQMFVIAPENGFSTEPQSCQFVSSDSRNIATQFAHGHRDIVVPNPVIAEAAILRHDIFAVITSRAEQL